jgi:hypothetical protein
MFEDEKKTGVAKTKRNLAKRELDSIFGRVTGYPE